MNSDTASLRPRDTMNSDTPSRPRDSFDTPSYRNLQAEGATRNKDWRSVVNAMKAQAQTSKVKSITSQSPENSSQRDSHPSQSSMAQSSMASRAKSMAGPPSNPRLQQSPGYPSN